MTKTNREMAEEIIDDATRQMFRSYTSAEEWGQKFLNDAIRDKAAMKKALTSALDIKDQQHKEEVEKYKEKAWKYDNLCK